MQPSEFKDKIPGALRRDPTGFWAFIPAPLPPDHLEPTWKLVGALSRADQALSELAGLARNLKNPHLLIQPFVRREAVLSSRIEGTQASLSDLLMFEAAKSTSIPAGRAAASDAFEVANYVRALDYGLARMKDLPLSLRLLREMHATLMEGVRGEHLTPGEFRRSQNWIGPPGCTLSEARYVPPPVPEMNQALGDLEKYLHAESAMPALVRLALVHYQFEAIHPFLDGNGRIGRLLISILLCTEGLLPQPLLYLSAYFERRRDEYYGRLLAVSRASAWNEWIEFFLNGVSDQARDAIWRTGRLLDLWVDYRGRFESARVSALLPRLVDDLFELPLISIPMAARKLGITQSAASKNIAKLVEAKILTEMTGRERNRLFFAREIIDIAEQEKPSGTKA